MFCVAGVYPHSGARLVAIMLLFKFCTASLRLMCYIHKLFDLAMINKLPGTAAARRRDCFNDALSKLSDDTFNSSTDTITPKILLDAAIELWIRSVLYCLCLLLQFLHYARSVLLSTLHWSYVTVLPLSVCPSTSVWSFTRTYGLKFQCVVFWCYVFIYPLRRLIASLLVTFVPFYQKSPLTALIKPKPYVRSTTKLRRCRIKLPLRHVNQPRRHREISRQISLSQSISRTSQLVTIICSYPCMMPYCWPIFAAAEIVVSWVNKYAFTPLTINITGNVQIVPVIKLSGRHAAHQQRKSCCRRTRRINTSRSLRLHLHRFEVEIEKQRKRFNSSKPVMLASPFDTRLVPAAPPPSPRTGLNNFDEVKNPSMFAFSGNYFFASKSVLNDERKQAERQSVIDRIGYLSDDESVNEDSEGVISALVNIDRFLAEQCIPARVKPSTTCHSARKRRQRSRNLTRRNRKQCINQREHVKRIFLYLRCKKISTPTSNVKSVTSPIKSSEPLPIHNGLYYDAVQFFSWSFDLFTYKLIRIPTWFIGLFLFSSYFLSCNLCCFFVITVTTFVWIDHVHRQINIESLESRPFTDANFYLTTSNNSILVIPSFLQPSVVKPVISDPDAPANAANDALAKLTSEFTVNSIVQPLPAAPKNVHTVPSPYPLLARIACPLLSVYKSMVARAVLRCKHEPHSKAHLRTCLHYPFTVPLAHFSVMVIWYCALIFDVTLNKFAILYRRFLLFTTHWLLDSTCFNWYFACVAQQRPRCSRVTSINVSRIFPLSKTVVVPIDFTKFFALQLLSDSTYLNSHTVDKVVCDEMHFMMNW